MTAPLPFRPRLRSSTEQIHARVFQQCLDVTLGKGDRRRRFWIRPGKLEGEWYCQVWLGGSQHRGETTSAMLRVQRLKAEYFREMDELEIDGWRVVDGQDPRPQKSEDRQ